MNVSELYRECQIPPNLQRHMLEVAAVAQAICDNWKGEIIDKSLVIKVALLHDLGNLIKFKRPFIGEIEKDAELWMDIQNKLREEFNDDVHQATMALARKAISDESILSELNLTGQTGSIEKFKTMEARIIQLADMCVSPVGIVGPQERIGDLIERYGNKVDQIDIDRHRENVQFISERLRRSLNEIILSITPQAITAFSRFEF
jgi:hypothetical protein